MAVTPSTTSTPAPINNVIAHMKQAQAGNSQQQLAVGNPALQIRKRVTLAQLNAGLTIVPAQVGYGLRLIDARVIAIGGAVTGATTVDIKGTVATVVQKLVAIAVAALTQSAVNRPGNANNTVLADGGSFVTLDKNTPITIGVTGSAAATATAVDVFLDFAADPLP